MSAKRPAYKKIALLCSAVTLGATACATFLDTSLQDVTFETPGAYNAICNVYVDQLRYRVRPPQTLNIHRADSDMTVDCQAPGNRRKVIYIKPQIEDTANLNIAHGGAGYVYDYASGALFKFPDRVEVDFTNAPVGDMPLPAQNKPDIRQPEDYPLEEFSPGNPRLNGDKDEKPTRILRRGEDDGFGNDSGSGGASSDDLDGLSHDKGNLMRVIESVTGEEKAPPAAPKAAPQGPPVPLIPGE